MFKPTLFDHLILLLGSFVMVGPVAYLLWQLVGATSLGELAISAERLWRVGVTSAGPGAATMLINSLTLALGLALVKGSVALCAAYALVFLPMRGRSLLYGAILVSMFFPIETRILPTFVIANHMNLLNTYTGLVLPVAASGLGVLVFRQFFRQIPKELIEAARIDGAGPLRRLMDIVLPLSVPMIAALFAILFVLGWNQYVWPLLLSTARQDMATLVGGMSSAGSGSASGQMLALLALIPPGLVVLLLQRWLIRGLTSGIH